MDQRILRSESIRSDAEEGEDKAEDSREDEEDEDEASLRPKASWSLRQRVRARCVLDRWIRIDISSRKKVCQNDACDLYMLASGFPLRSVVVSFFQIYLQISR